jgi:hypothetical protein
LASLAPKAFFKTDYRGLAQLLQGLAELREELDLADVPRYSTLCRAAKPLLKERSSYHSSSRLPRAQASGLTGAKPEAALDATGLQSRHASQYSFRRAGRWHSARLWTKLMVVCDTGGHLFAAATVSTAPSNDSPQLRPAMRQASLAMTWDCLLADAAFDS